MTDRLLLLSTCGTSLLTYGASAHARAWHTKIANDVEVDAARLMPIVEERRESLKAADAPTRRKMSAELNDIGAVLDRYKPKQLFHLLVHTDTAPGKATELYAWSDGATGRLFGHYDASGVFVFDRLAGHLQ